MHFLLHAGILPKVAEALLKHGHTAHAAEELSGDTDAPASLAGDPAALLKLLTARQWQLITTDAAFVRVMYEEDAKIPSDRVIVLLLECPTDELQAEALARLFERYKRLTPKRLYTVTPGRVKIRQLPGPP